MVCYVAVIHLPIFRWARFRPSQCSLTMASSCSPRPRQSAFTRTANQSAKPRPTSPVIDFSDLLKLALVGIALEFCRMESTQLARLRRVAGKQTGCLTHYGRKTGKPYDVTICFVLSGDKLYIGTAT